MLIRELLYDKKDLWYCSILNPTQELVIAMMPNRFQRQPEDGARPLGNYLFMRPLLNLFGDGQFVYKGMVLALRACAALLVLASLATFFKAGKTVFSLNTTGAIFGGIMFELFFILAVYAVAHTLVIRAKNIEAMDPGHYFMLPLGSVLVRMLGEAYAAFIALIAIGSGIFVWFTSQKISTILGPLTQFFPALTKPDFIGGIEFMVTGILIAIGALIATYMLSELVMIASDSVNRRGSGNNSGSSPRQLPSRPSIKSRLGS